MKLASIYPNRIVVRHRPNSETRPFVDRYFDKEINKWENRLLKESTHNNHSNLSEKKKSVNLSNQSKRKLRDSIMLLYQLSKPRTVKINNKRSIFNYRASFITLTLPSEQLHSDVEIKKCLNIFLTNCRQSLKIDNYVWKAELQKNDNIHFHLIFDKYVTYQSIRYYWNKAVESLGYVTMYSNRFKNMSLYHYSKYRNMLVEDCKEAYAKGVKSRWTSPNSVDVKSVHSDKQLAVYLSKYFAKSDESNINSNRIENFGKVWSRSQSLSKIKLITRWDWNNIKDLINQYLNSSKDVVHKIYQWNEVYYFKFNTMSKKFQKWIYNNLVRQAKHFHYPFPVVP